MRMHLLWPFVLALASVAHAQVGQIGMKTSELRAKLGPPHEVDHLSGDKLGFYKGLDEAWFYRGRDENMSFAYGIDEGTVLSTTALISHGSLAEAEQRAEQVVAAMEQKGWTSEKQRAHHYELHSSATTFMVEIVAERGAYCVVLSHAARTLAREDDSRRLDGMLAFHSPTSRLPDPDPAVAVVPPVRTTASSAEPEPEEDAGAGKPDRVSAAASTPSGFETASSIPTPSTEASPPESDRATQEWSNEIDPARGGYTWVVSSQPGQDVAEAIARSYRQKGFRSSVIRAIKDERAVYRVGVGQYSTRQALQAARRQFPPEAPSDMWPLRIEPEMQLIASGSTQ